MAKSEDAFDRLMDSARALLDAGYASMDDDIRGVALGLLETGLAHPRIILDLNVASPVCSVALATRDQGCVRLFDVAGGASPIGH